MQIEFEHRPSAHCENGVICNILRFYGFELSEPMVFGLAYGLFFSYMPFITLAGQPVTSFRTFPGALFSRVAKSLGFKMETRRFLNEQHAMDQLDALIDKGIPVACVVGMYYLTYMPVDFRFMFNGHNICIVGREGDIYTVSDSIANQKVTISRKDLQRVRFTKGGTFPLMGMMYWIKEAPTQLPPLAPLIKKAILKNCWYMISQPSVLPWFGVNGIDSMGRSIPTWPKHYGRKAALALASVIRMLEEIGTGGAGFRFMYAAFLQMAAKETGIEVLNDFSRRLTTIGDHWREFAAHAAAIYKRRPGAETYEQVGAEVAVIGQEERTFWTELRALPQLKK